MRVDVGLLGRRLLLQCKQRRPDANVEVRGDPNSHSNANRDADSDRFTKAYSNTKASSGSAASPDSAKVKGLQTADHLGDS